MKKLVLALAALLALVAPAYAQSSPGLAAVVAACGTPPNTYTAGTNRPILQNTSGQTCSISSASGGSTPTKPASLTLVPLDVSSVTTGGTAVTALIAGHATAGGFLTNPKAATIDLCINQIGTASGTTSAGSLTCIVPGQAFNLVPSTGAVSVITSDSAHPFSGEGYQ